jgi:hypothetical protein
LEVRVGTWEYKLARPPRTERGRELWLQHAAGFILFEDVRGYAAECIDKDLSPEARAAALKGVDDALYGLMMVLDGVAGSLSNTRMRVQLHVAVQLMKESESGGQTLLREVDLAAGDGMCMGYHGWKAGDFGEAPVVARSRTRTTGSSKRTSTRKSARLGRSRTPKR